MAWDNTSVFADDSVEDRDFRAEVRAWVLANCPPELVGRAAHPTPAELKPWHRRLFERGWIAPHWPREHGGMGATLAQQLILWEEITRLEAPTPLSHGLNLIGPIIIEVGTPEQKAQHLPRILSGEITWCQGYSEEGAGSDLASLATSAALDDDHFVVKGHKIWTTQGQHADWMFALVRTDPDAKPRHAGISMLLIDMKSPGVSVRPIETLRGDAEFAMEFFDDVRVPRANLLGEMNGGWRLANMVLGAERMVTGHPRTAANLLNRVRDVAKLTGAADDPAFRQRLAAIEIEMLAFSAYFRHGAALHMAKRAPNSLAPVLKIVGGELAQRAAELLVEAGGARGPMADDWLIGNASVNLPHALFESRRFTVGAGSVEIQRNVIAKRVLGLPSS